MGERKGGSKGKYERGRAFSRPSFDEGRVPEFWAEEAEDSIGF